MHEIKVRGKRKDNGKWVYGNKLETSEGVFIVPIKALVTIHRKADDLHVSHLEIFSYYQVIPETVGQYTGRKANGQEIYADMLILRLNESRIWKVTWSKVELQWTLQDITDGMLCPLTAWPAEHIEVIGDIHTPPEL